MKLRVTRVSRLIAAAVILAFALSGGATADEAADQSIGNVAFMDETGDGTGARPPIVSLVLQGKAIVTSTLDKLGWVNATFFKDNSTAEITDGFRRVQTVRL